MLSLKCATAKYELGLVCGEGKRLANAGLMYRYTV